MAFPTGQASDRDLLATPSTSSRGRQTPIRVLVADDEPQVREALADLINEEPTLQLVGVAVDADEAILMADAQPPDVAVLDVAMPKGGGPKAAREIRIRHPETRLLAFSAYEDGASVQAMLGEGVAGYVLKGTPVEEILDAIHRSAKGDATLSQDVTTDVVAALGEHLKRERAATRHWEQRRERIQRTIDESAFVVLFQPIVHLPTECLAGFEAVARFTLEPERPTEEWFTEALAVGLVKDLELATARAALGSLERLAVGSYLSINLSPETASSPEFRDLLIEVDHDRLVVEMTEHTPIEDYPKLNEAVHDLRWRGVRLAIDDVGAGFASLRHILELSPDFIKLDVTLTRDIDREEPRRILAGALTAFAKAIGIEIVAEGIQTEQELAVLRSLGVTFGQGFYLGAPGPLPV
jgi:EAL domain-containing protein (putative c-di-GMP-specific phosphodiesterase class I)/DNA-binding NarL/FixJ family response regulator